MFKTPLPGRSEQTTCFTLHTSAVTLIKRGALHSPPRGTAALKTNSPLVLPRATTVWLSFCSPDKAMPASRHTRLHHLYEPMVSVAYHPQRYLHTVQERIPTRTRVSAATQEPSSASASTCGFSTPHHSAMMGGSTMRLLVRSD